MHDFHALHVYHKSRLLIPRVYEICDALPRTELFGIGSQLRRAAVSVRSNIVEGSKRSDKEFAQFLKYSIGSAQEARGLLQDIVRLKMDVLCAADAVQCEYGSVGLMLHSLRRKLSGYLSVLDHAAFCFLSNIESLSSASCAGPSS